MNIKERCREYFDTPLNKETNWYVWLVEQDVTWIYVIRPNVMGQKKYGTAAGVPRLDIYLINSEWKRRGYGIWVDGSGVQISCVVNREWEEWTCTDDKQKGDALECTSYRWINLLRYSNKRIFEYILRELIEIDEIQFGCNKWKGTT